MRSQTVLSDRVLIVNARAGSRNAFGELVLRHSSLIFGMSLKMLRNREDAEDNLQNALCKAYGKIKQFEGNSQFSTWLLRIAINEALMTLRKRGPAEAAIRADQHVAADDPRTKSELRDVYPDPERQCLVKEFASKVLEALPHPLKHTFILQKREGWTNRELAGDSGHHPSKRKISHLSGSCETAPAHSGSVKDKIDWASRLKQGGCAASPEFHAALWLEASTAPRRRKHFGLLGTGVLRSALTATACRYVQRRTRS